ncbi:V-type proton ATPase subunit S1 [Austrofundulus limnaeus]|uniref:V-type proton ATPase subunit S1 n=1 Tax=Austrofundulus limnaeus TaxID=52670 RepID=A0A2I4D6H0_AUSLI|nr:PREDICTED: V-type proton ATPase subunit S1-like [Austrofundulus limnaeus]
MAETSGFGGAGFLTFIFYFCSSLGCGSGTAQVPVLLWSTDSFPGLAPPSAGHMTSMQELSLYLSSVFGSGSHNVLLFLQDKLSKDDFTVFGGVFGNKQDSTFKNLQAAMQSSSSSVTVPALEWAGPSAIPSLLQEQLGVSPLPVDAETLSHLSLPTSANSLLLISLPYCSSSPKSCREVLNHNDEIIGKVVSFLKAKHVPYTAIYTGLQPSRVISEASVSHQQVGRSLLQTAGPVPAPIMFLNGSSVCIMLWAQNLYISTSGGAVWVDLFTESPDLTGSMCNDQSSLLVLTYASGYRLSFAMTRQFYPVSARHWFTLDSVQLQINGTSQSFIGRSNIYAPAEYSFHCGSVSSFHDALLVPNTTTDQTQDWRLNFIDFQIQGFSLSNGTTFSYASDCAGFFSAGIWMGLLSSLLMLLILVYGLHMILQVNTMDRFDDPKGPSISVPQSE